MSRRKRVENVISSRSVSVQDNDLIEAAERKKGPSDSRLSASSRAA